MKRAFLSLTYPDLLKNPFWSLNRKALQSKVNPTFGQVASPYILIQ